MHMDTEGGQEGGYNCTGEERPSAEMAVEVLIDNEFLDSSHFDAENCKEGRTCCGLGASRQT